MDTPKRQIVVNTNPGHNKYWMITPIDPQGLSYGVRNGRLGTNGQAQKPLLRWDALGKLQNKLCNGYRRVDEREFERLNTQAAIVGSTNKCEELRWVEQDGERYRPVGDDRLANPAYDPKLLVRITTRKDVDGSTDFYLLFTPEASYKLSAPSRHQDGSYSGHPVPVRGELLKLARKVETAMGRLFHE